MSFPTSLIGDEYPGTHKWFGGVLASDGCIYAAPLMASQILKIDPNNRTTALVGAPIPGFGVKYFGAMATNDGYIYFVPCQAAQVLKFNIQTQAIQLVGEKYGGGPTTVKWLGGAMGNDGCFYCAPSLARQILKVDPSNDTTSLVGDNLGGDGAHQKYSGAVASQDKATIYFSPHGAKTILTYDVNTERCTHINIDHLDYGREGAKWTGGMVLAPDGCIYAMPSGANKILKYDPSRSVNGPTLDNYDSSRPENPTLVGDDLGSLSRKWTGSVLGRDGCIYGIPGDTSKVLRYNPLSNTTTLVGNDFSGAWKWFGGVLDNNGNIIAMPCNHPRVLRIIPSLFSHNPRSTTTYQPSGMDDSPNNRADRLGYELYAEALVDHILSVERTGESISVGLFSPWGSGKSFFWNLSKQEFQRRDQQEQKGYQDSAVEQDHGTEMADERSFVSFFLDVARSLEEYRGKFWHWPLVILFWITMFPVAIIWALNKYLKSVISILDYKLINSPCGDKYKSLQGMILLWQKNIVSFCSLAFLGIPLLWDYVWKVIGFFFRSFFFCYKRGMWKIKRHKDTIYIYVEFDAWTYRGTENIWASMLEMMWRAVEEELGSEKVNWHRAGIALAGIKLSDPLDIRLKKEEMARKKLQIQLNVSISFFAWSLTACIAAIAVFFVNSYQADGNTEKCRKEGIFGCVINHILIATLSASTIVSVVNLVVRVQNNKAVLQPGSKKITDKVNYYNRKDFKQDIGFMGLVQDEVVYLFEFLKSQNARIRLFVDDLDRCNQEVAMDVLWAISLLFGPKDDPSPITSFLAIDSKVLVDYIEDEFDGKANGFGYLEKIINLPFAIPPIGNEKKIDFCERAVDTHELNVSQVYRKALNFKYKYLGKTQDIVDHLNDRILKIGNKQALLGDLILMGEKMNSSGEDRLAYVDFDLLVPSNVTERSSRQEELLVVLRKNIDILENDARSIHRPSDVYNDLYNLLSKNIWLGEVLGVSLSQPRNHKEFLVLSMRSDDNLVCELYKECCVSGRSENMRKAFPMPEKLDELKGIESSRAITQYVKNVTENLDEMLKNLNVNCVLELCKRQIHVPVASPDNMDEEDELCLLALRLDLKAPNAEFSDNSEEWKRFLFKVQLVLKTQLVSQNYFEHPGNNDDKGDSGRDIDDGNHDGEMSRNNSSSDGGTIDDSDKSTLGTNSDSIPATKIGKMEPNSEERPFYEYKSMVTDDERKFLRVYSCFLDGVPRKIKRILNVYNVTRYIAKKANGGSVESVFLEKLFILTILQELCPYRTSWLMFLSQFAQEEDGIASSLEVKDESIPFRSLLEDLQREEGYDNIKDLSLATIHSRIVSGVMHCIPSAERNLHADSGIISYETLLKTLVLGDLFPNCLQNYAFNLPRSMMNEIKMYKNHCIVSKRIVRMESEEDDKSYWVACTVESARNFKRNGMKEGYGQRGNNNDVYYPPRQHNPRYIGFDGVVCTSHMVSQQNNLEDH